MSIIIDKDEAADVYNQHRQPSPLSLLSTLRRLLISIKTNTIKAYKLRLAKQPSSHNSTSKSHTGCQRHQPKKPKKRHHQFFSHPKQSSSRSRSSSSHLYQVIEPTAVSSSSASQFQLSISSRYSSSVIQVVKTQVALQVVTIPKPSISSCLKPIQCIKSKYPCTGIKSTPSSRYPNLLFSVPSKPSKSQVSFSSLQRPFSSLFNSLDTQVSTQISDFSFKFLVQVSLSPT